MNPAALIREARDRAELTQAEMAARAGVHESFISAYERGRRTPGIKTLNKLLAAAGFQLAAQLEPVGADADASIRRALAASVEERLQQLPFQLPELVARMSGRPLVVAGLAAAVLQGEPVECEAVDLLIADDDEELKALIDILHEHSLAVWVEEHCRHIREVPLPVYLRTRNPTRWLDVLGERYLVHVVSREATQEQAWVRRGDQSIPVKGLWEIESADPAVATRLARTRELAALGGDDGAEDDPLGNAGLGGDRGDGFLTALAG